MATQCPECGARFESEESCRDRFDKLLGIEYSDPAYFAVHHLSVTAYQLQHNHYSRQGWLTTLSLLRRFLDEGLSPQQAARAMHHASARNEAGHSWTRGEKLPLAQQPPWSKTISDTRFETAEQYCADVREWAVAVCRDAEAKRAAAKAG